MQAGEKRGSHADKKTRVAPYLDTDHYGKIKRLAIACDVTPAALALEMLNYCLDHPQFVMYIQDEHKVRKDSSYRVVPIVDKEQNRVIY